MPDAAGAAGGPVLSVEGVRCHFDVSGSWIQRRLAGAPKRILRAVDDVSFSVERGTTSASWASPVAGSPR